LFHPDKDFGVVVGSSAASRPRRERHPGAKSSSFSRGGDLVAVALQALSASARRLFVDQRAILPPVRIVRSPLRPPI